MTSSSSPPSNIFGPEGEDGDDDDDAFPSESTAIPLPESLRVLYPLAENLYWVWNRRIRRVFETIDPAAWHGLGHNPISLLSHIGESRLRELSNDSSFLGKVKEASDLQRRYLRTKKATWFHKRYGILGGEHLVAYFSAEFAVASCIRTYSGGLGVLSADHLKAASDLGIPLVGVGLFYKRGYFSQGIAADGLQFETYPVNDPDELPIQPVLDPGVADGGGSEHRSGESLVISVPLGERQVRLRAWRVAVGRVPLYLLDSSLPGLNSKEDCEITSELYGGDIETRIKQEVVLGFGGAKLLRSLGIKPSLYHMNEGHSAFVTLEEIRESMEQGEERDGRKEKNNSFASAAEENRSRNLFTTHTPVPAGIDVFPRQLFEKYLGAYAGKFGISTDELFSLGQETSDSHGFNMAVLALRLSSYANAVSKLHKVVADKNWSHVLSPSKKNDDGQLTHTLGSITNGVHTASWTSDAMAELFDEYLGPGWSEDPANPDAWRKVADIPSGVLWRARRRMKTRLVRFISENYFETSDQPSSLDPEALTIGFARRFATYKRATLFLKDAKRLRRLLGSSERKKVQFIFAGKAHPRDLEGKKLIQQIVSFSKSCEGECRGRVVFLNDYDLTIAKELVSGVDVWLNNPRRPLEASGTSGMKAIPNGALNFSVLDGWWDEAYSPQNGWAIGKRDDSANDQEDDAQSLYDVLENEIIPEFYDSRVDGIPERWVGRVKNSILTLAPRFNTRRMVTEYAEKYYFGDESEFADRLNRSELGVELLEKLHHHRDSSSL